jgi:hypothetical protein
MMKYSTFLILYLLFIYSCNNERPGPISNKQETSIIKKDTVHKNVDAVTERNKIITYFEKHKHEDTFDTTDIVYAQWWGLWQSNVNSITAGHLFSRQHIHAAMYLPIVEGKATVQVYIKTNNEWVAIFADSSLTDDMDMTFADWNGDGIKDLSLANCTSVIDNDQTYKVYIVDSSGLHIQEVAGFEELRSPERDIASGHIITENQYHNTETLGEYSIAGTKVIKISEVFIHDDGDDTCIISFIQNNKHHKEIKTSDANVIRYLPAIFRKRTLYNPAK